MMFVILLLNRTASVDKHLKPHLWRLARTIRSDFRIASAVTTPMQSQPPFMFPFLGSCAEPSLANRQREQTITTSSVNSTVTERITFTIRLPSYNNLPFFCGHNGVQTLLIILIDSEMATSSSP